MPRSRSLPSLDRAQPGRPAPQAGTALRDAERTLPSALQVPIEQLVPDPDQPRRAMDRNRLTELAGSLTEYGVLQPLLVRADGFLDDGRTRYMIIAGGRRYAAAQQAGLTHLPVVVSDSKDAQLRIIQLTENIQREELNAVEEARALKELMDLQSIGSRVVAERLHRSHTYVANRLKLIEHEDVAQAIRETPTISTSVALEIARERDATARQEMLREAANKPLRKEDAQRLRRGRKEPTAPPRPPTLREVAREMGASEDQARAAAEVRKTDPEVSPAEAVALAIHKPVETGATTTTLEQPKSTVTTLEQTKPTVLEDEDRNDRDLRDVMGEAGPIVTRVLEWAQGRGLDLADLAERCRRVTNTVGV